MPDPKSLAASFDVVLPLAMFSPEASKRAAYVLMARAMVAFEMSSQDVRCTIRPAAISDDHQQLERDFRREVIDQDLRIEIEARTEPMRNAILGLTFSRTGLQG
jgi:His-Xaa-Ser system protein HxsD